MTRGFRLALKLVLAAGCVLAVAALGKLAFDSLRYPVTTATPAHFASAELTGKINNVLAEERPRVQLRRMVVPDLAASAAALENKQADLAVIRTDVKLPPDGRTIAIMGRDPVFLIVPAGSAIESFRDLKGRSVAVLATGRDELALLDRLLEYYAVPPKTVDRAVMDASDIGPAFRQKRIAAVFAIANPAVSPAIDAFAAVAKASKGTPDIIGVEEADAIAKRFGDVESDEIAQGAFGGASPRPEESLATIFVTYRLMARRTMPDLIAGEVARNLMLAKARLLSTSPLASRIEAPDADEDTVPIHPGASAFYNDEQTSIVDRFESLFWMGSAFLSIVGSLVAWALSRFGARSKNPSDFGARLLEILRDARKASLSELEDLEAEVDDIVGWLVERSEASQFASEEIATLTFAVSQAREGLRKRKEALTAAPTPQPDAGPNTPPRAREAALATFGKQPDANKG